MGRKRKQWVGQIFGKWTVLRDDLPYGALPRMLWCRCECGHEKYVKADALADGRTKECNECAGQPTVEQIRIGNRNLEGEVFGTYTIVADDSPRRVWNRKVRARCGCGREKLLPARDFVDPRKQPRQRCITCSNMARRHVTEEQWELRPIYHQMVMRCTDPRSSNWSGYGGRGIRVIADWLGDGGFQRFSAYIIGTIGRRPSKRHTLDRIDGQAGYEPANLRWSTPKEQASNRRKPMPFQPRGLTRQLVHAALLMLKRDRIAMGLTALSG